MNTLPISALIAAAAFSASALADNGRGHRDHWKHRQHHHPQHVVVPYAYAPPVVIYRPAPVVVYREPIVYHEPVYYEAPPRYYERPAAYGGGNRLMGQTLGAIAGGALGTQIGQGNGRIAATAIGAVVGGALGGHAAGY